MKFRIVSAVILAGVFAGILACGGTPDSSTPAGPSSSGTSATSTSNPTPAPTPGPTPTPAPSPTPTPTPTVQTGTLAIAVKDSPFSDASALLITFSEVSVHSASDDSWMTLPFTGGATVRTCDLKKLTSATDILGTAALAAGHYTQIRLTVSKATLYFGGSSSGTCGASVTVSGSTKNVDVNIPSGTIKLNREFDLAGGATTTILLDFDGDKSVRELGNGKYQMSPVISIVSVQ
jgi:hypothetical protein